MAGGTPAIRPAEYWLVLDPSQNVLPLSNARVHRTVPIPAVRSLGIDISGVHRPGVGYLYLGFAHGSAVLVLEPDVDRYVFDAESGFRGFDPYERGWLMIGMGPPGGKHRVWQTTLRAVPGWGEGGRP